MTKDQELQAVAELAERLGDESYLGAWLRDALPWFRSQLAADMTPETPEEVQRRAQMVLMRAEEMRADTQRTRERVCQELHDRRVLWLRERAEGTRKDRQRMERVADALQELRDAMKAAGTL